MAKQINFAAAQQNYAQSGSKAVAKFSAGVQATTSAPGAAAAAQSAKWAANTAAAVGKWSTNVAAVSLDSWKAATVAKSNRLVTGFQQGAQKWGATMTKFASQIQALRDKVVGERGTVSGDQRYSDWSAGMKQIFGKS